MKRSSKGNKLRLKEGMNSKPSSSFPHSTKNKDKKLKKSNSNEFKIERSSKSPVNISSTLNNFLKVEDADFAHLDSKSKPNPHNLSQKSSSEQVLDVEDFVIET